MQVPSRVAQGESHTHAPTEPDVTVSRYTAPTSHMLEVSPFDI